MNVGEMQRKLSLWATQDKERRFDDLYGLVCHPDWLRAAHDKVKRNTGSITAGCDGITMKTFDEHLDAQLETLRQDLKAKTFQPHPVRRVMIPKANGKQRPLGIPSIRDRVVQEALRMVLEPIFESDFLPYSFGFRPTRRTMDAIRAVLQYANENKKFFWVVEGDIASYFDTVKHRKLMRRLKRRVSDRRVLDLIWQFLKAGVMEGKLFKATEQGVPQGGIISPLLANVYLHDLDTYIWNNHVGVSDQAKRRRRQHGEGNVAYIRYADDFVVLTNGSKEVAKALRADLHTFLAERLGLSLSLEKTKVTHLNEGFEFLGFRIQRRMGSKGMTTKVDVPLAAQRRIRAKLAAVFGGDYGASVTTKFQAANRTIGGWCRYYQYCSNVAKPFSNLEYVTFWLAAHWLGRKYRLSMPTVMKRFRQDDGLGVGDTRLLMASAFKAKSYRERYLKPNPYLSGDDLTREARFDEATWLGQEARPGQQDAKRLLLAEAGPRCADCGKTVPVKLLDLDHIRPVSRFNSIKAANRPHNLQLLCKTCHNQKTESDR